MDLQWLQVAAAGASAVAAIFSARAAIKAPERAAEAAAKILRTVQVERDAAEQAKQIRDRKFQALLILMAHRTNYGQALPSQHMNLIDLLWIDNKEVRDAWALFYKAVQSDQVGLDIRKERFRFLLSAMSKDLGLADRLTLDDMERHYYPNAVGWAEQAEGLRNQAMIGDFARYMAQSQTGQTQPD